MASKAIEELRSGSYTVRIDDVVNYRQVVTLERAERIVGELEAQLAGLIQEKQDGFCSHLEILCGDCTAQKGFAIWHRPPSCEEQQ